MTARGLRRVATSPARSTSSRDGGGQPGATGDRRRIETSRTPLRGGCARFGITRVFERDRCTHARERGARRQRANDGERSTLRRERRASPTDSGGATSGACKTPYEVRQRQFSINAFDRPIDRPYCHPRSRAPRRTPLSAGHSDRRSEARRCTARPRPASARAGGSARGAHSRRTRRSNPGDGSQRGGISRSIAAWSAKGEPSPNGRHRSPPHEAHRRGRVTRIARGRRRRVRELRSEPALEERRHGPHQLAALSRSS